MRALSAIVVLVLLVACAPLASPQVRELHTSPAAFALPEAEYYGVAWIQPDLLAFAVDDPHGKSRLILTSQSGKVVRNFEPPLAPECALRTYRGLIRLPTGEIGAAEICTVDSAGPPEIGSLIAVDATTLELRELGPTAEPPSWLAWRTDMTAAVYSVGDDLCAVLYERTDKDLPLKATVKAQGTTFDVGLETASDPDRCPDRGRASYPAFGRHDQLAFMASANSGREGQDLIDLPWALFVQAEDEDPREALDGIVWPRGLAWLDDDRLVFSGAVGGVLGIWSIRADGKDLVRVADEEASWLAVSPDSHGLVAIREVLLGDDYVTDVVTYDLQKSGL
jgi:hypothetical protein